MIRHSISLKIIGKDQFQRLKILKMIKPQTTMEPSGRFDVAYELLNIQ